MCRLHKSAASPVTHMVLVGSMRHHPARLQCQAHSHFNILPRACSGHPSRLQLRTRPQPGHASTHRYGEPWPWPQPLATAAAHSSHFVCVCCASAEHAREGELGVADGAAVLAALHPLVQAGQVVVVPALRPPVGSVVVVWRGAGMMAGGEAATRPLLRLLCLIIVMMSCGWRTEGEHACAREVTVKQIVLVAPLASQCIRVSHGRWRGHARPWLLALDARPTQNTWTHHAIQDHFIICLQVAMDKGKQPRGGVTHVLGLSSVYSSRQVGQYSESSSSSACDTTTLKPAVRHSSTGRRVTSDAINRMRAGTGGMRRRQSPST